MFILLTASDDCTAYCRSKSQPTQQNEQISPGKNVSDICWQIKWSCIIIVVFPAHSLLFYSRYRYYCHYFQLLFNPPVYPELCQVKLSLKEWISVSCCSDLLVRCPSCHPRNSINNSTMLFLPCLFQPFGTTYLTVLEILCISWTF